MASSTVDNKFVQINKWGLASDPGVLSLATEHFNISNIKDE